MRRVILVLLASLVTIGVLLSVGAPQAHAEDLTPEQAGRVKANCVSIKNSINQLHASDALLRVNRGQVYESMASKLMDTFNSRLESNRLDNKATLAVTTNYRTALTQFRTDYIAYEQKLSEAIRIDCTSQPNTFYAALQEARELRKDVHESVQKLHRLIDDYRTSVGDFLMNFERVSK